MTVDEAFSVLDAHFTMYDDEDMWDALNVIIAHINELESDM